ncbi:MAG: MupA/Atu3671 family FMN-dependent luciferase-like monooxygenase [Candidatus Sericytochromatia bacterium]
MIISDFLKELEKNNIFISLVDKDLKIQAPKGSISPEIKKNLLEKKEEIIHFLSKSKKSINFSIFFFGGENTVIEQDKYSLLIESAKFADSNNFYGIWTPERHFHNLGGIFPNPAIIAGALSLITKNLKLRAGSVVLPLHDPIRVVEDWSVVDNLSKGRAEISVASGWHVNDFVLKSKNYKDRKNIMFEEIKKVRDLWSGIALKRENGAGQEIEVNTHPEPFQKDIPIWITAIGSPDTYIKAGKLGCNLMTCLLDQDINELKEKLDLYKKTLEENGFNTKDKKIAVFLHTYIGKSLEESKKMVYEPFKNYLRETINLLGKYSTNSEIKLNPDELPEEEKEILLDFAFERYFEGRSLIGDLEKCEKTVESLIDIGVNEIACLLDFGLTDEYILDGLKNLSVLVNKYKSN